MIYKNEFYFQGLIEGINTALNKRKDEDEFNSELTRRDIIKCIQSERVKFRGMNLSGLDLSKLVMCITLCCFWKKIIYVISSYFPAVSVLPLTMKVQVM